MEDGHAFTAREFQRYALEGAVDVYDADRDAYLGRLVNLHARGLMLVGDQPLEEDRLYQLDLHLPRPIKGRSIVRLGVDCLWTRNADHNGKHWAGFTIIDAGPEAGEAIGLLIDILGG